jgi:hypothetical protein
MKCKLTRITENDHTRTKEIVGECDYKPELDWPFTVIAPPIDTTKHHREVTTTRVKNISRDPTNEKKMIFWTENTEYEFELLD